MTNEQIDRTSLTRSTFKQGDFNDVLFWLLITSDEGMKAIDGLRR